MRTRTLGTAVGMLSVLTLVVGCASTVAGSPTARSSLTLTTAAQSSSAPTGTVPAVQQSTVTQTVTATPEPSTPVPPLPSPDPRIASDAEIRAEVGNAVTVVDQYWQNLFATWYGPNGEPVYWWTPQLLNGDGFFDSASGPSPRCGTDADVDTTGNAFFCGKVISGTGYMAWDMQFFRDRNYLGKFVAYMVVAHETAHAAQVRFVHDGEAPAVVAEYELQADCIAGATLAKAEQDGYLTIGDGDLEAMIKVSHSLGDYSGDIHGTPEERAAWFMTGYQGNIESCLGNR